MTNGAESKEVTEENSEMKGEADGTNESGRGCCMGTFDADEEVVVEGDDDSNGCVDRGECECTDGSVL